MPGGAAYAAPLTEAERNVLGKYAPRGKGCNDCDSCACHSCADSGCFDSPP